jgi:predicted ester cyclase
VVDESLVHARATGRPMGLEGRDRPVTFRLLHIFDIEDGRIRRENAWLDTAAIVGQLG